MITELHHLRFGERAHIQGHLVERFVTGYEVDGGPALSFDEATVRLAELAAASNTEAGSFSDLARIDVCAAAARTSLAPYNLQLPADRAGLEKLVKSLGRYAGDEGRALVAAVEAVLIALRRAP